MATRPNVLFIQPDQHRYDCQGHVGNALAHTPNIDGLARSGVRFTHAFTPVPTCCPTRQSLLCGRWPQAHGGLWNYGTGLPMALFDQPTWTEALAADGYTLGYVGKWEVHPTRGPDQFGFRDHVNARDYAAWRHAEGLPDYQRDADRLTILKDKPVTRWFGGVDPAPLHATRTHWYAERAIEYMRRYAAEGRPWHIRLDFEEPHLPCFPAEPFASRIAPDQVPSWGSFGETFEGKPYIQQQQLYSWGIEALTWDEWSVYVARYLGMLAQIDDAIGRVLGALDELGQAENTLVIYSTDHGDNTGSHRLIDKHYVMYDDVVHVPLLLRWPARFGAGVTRDEFVVHALDLATTICEATGLPVPEAYAGRSLMPLCCDEQPPDWRQDVVAVYNGAQFGLFMQRMLRDRHWKYVWNPTDVDELYDLQADPWELHNRIADAACADVLRELRQRLLTQLIAQGDALVRTDWTRVQLSEGRKLVR